MYDGRLTVGSICNFKDMETPATECEQYTYAWYIFVILSKKETQKMSLLYLCYVLPHTLNPI